MDDVKKTTDRTESVIVCNGGFHKKIENIDEFLEAVHGGNDILMPMAGSRLEPKRIRVAGIPIKIFGELEEDEVPVVVIMGGREGTPVWSGLVGLEEAQWIHGNPKRFLEELIKEIGGLSELIGDETKIDLSNKLFLGVGGLKPKGIRVAGIPIKRLGEKEEGDVLLEIHIGGTDGEVIWSGFVGLEGKQWIEENPKRFLEELIDEAEELSELIKEKAEKELEFDVFLTIGSA